ncbi:DUF1398 domain-containing protein [Pollutibacter soli]|uniref:DUF1398 domain-containing protein n=1 Tax=Pollutibacter soli TaxID=3034157 RepID=UPI00301405D9
MFTIDQIQKEHQKVKSGADFPVYINSLKTLGVSWYQTWVFDGHTDFNGGSTERISSKSKYANLTIAESCNAAQFEIDLQTHQKGGTDYPTFCRQSADAGIEKWIVDLNAMTCTYFDKKGNTVLTENIPG